MARLGLLGGSFDPVHVAHLILAERAREERALDRVLFIPARQSPHKLGQPPAPDADRLRMLELAVEGHPAFEVLPLELERPAPSYTLLTVRELRQRMGTAELFLLMGSDSLRDLDKWWQASELVREVDVIALERPSFPIEEALSRLAGQFGQDWAERTRRLAIRGPLLEISATDIRSRIRNGRSIRYLVPEPVRRYIEQRGLYAVR